MREPLPAHWIVPDWPAPSHVRAFVTTRRGGVSTGRWGVPPHGRDGMNLGLKSDEAVERVRANRALLRRFLPAEPLWLKQVHGTTVVDAAAVAQASEPPEADGAFCNVPQVVCTATAADCLPVLFTDIQGRAVAAAHAGWRGLAAGILQHTVRVLRERLGEPQAQILAYIGPGIGPTRFEVGPDVLAAMQTHLPQAATAFVPQGHGKYLADLFALARQALAQVGVTSVFGGRDCTASDPQRFYSFRRDGTTGRHAALIWLEPQNPELDQPTP